MNKSHGLLTEAQCFPTLSVSVCLWNRGMKLTHQGKRISEQCGGQVVTTWKGHTILIYYISV